ncbi:uncharacterized protein LOC128732425 [Sabethes cyaneus]|uniref:uncharacterized protein LOC128732425 n=1 Tax=Sabethes cyaneus TaxID=53552 RepID=UPI00237E9C67|nr:uncharacterized protein LOC128732425 [Sabethes cyaneus]
MDSDLQRLIMLVSERKPIWDKSFRPYRNKLLVSKYWRQVADEFGGNVKVVDLKKKWKGLRDKYLKELKKIPPPKRAEPNIVMYCKWPYFESMMFLRNSVNPRKVVLFPSDEKGDKMEDEPSVPTKAEYNTIDIIDMPSAYEVDSSTEGSYFEPQLSISTSSSCNRRNDQPHSTQQEPAPACDDEDELFFKSILPHVRKLEPEHKLAFRTEVQTLVLQYVYRKNSQYLQTSGFSTICARMDIDIERLIALVFARRQIWDKSVKHYRNRELLEKHWQDISNELGCAKPYPVKKKWKSLRDSFYKELKSIPREEWPYLDGSAYEMYGAWPHFASMLFLRNSIKPRTSSGDPSYGDIERLEDSDHCEESKPVRVSSYDQAELAELPEIDDYMEDEHTSVSDDEDEAFFRSLLPHVRKLEPEAKLAFRIELQNLVQLYVYGTNTLDNQELKSDD